MSDEAAETTAVVDTLSSSIARRAPELLRAFNHAGVLHAADVHVATRLGGIGGESDEAVLLAAALAVRGPRIGHVHVDLETIAGTAAVDLEEEIDLSSMPWPEPEGWVERVAASPLVGAMDADPERPLRIWDSRLYLDRYWRAEDQVAKDLLAMAVAPAALVDAEATEADLARLFPGEEADGRQAEAAAKAAAGRLTVVAGGPGTGKTTTVARIAALLIADAERGGRTPLIGFAAPTGKAAQRLTEAIREEAGGLDVEESVRERLQESEAATLHRLLGWKPGTSSRFRHDRDDRLPYEVIIVDETSMVPLWIMSRLLEAVRPEARLVLIGDPGQLASVEAGAVLGDIVAGGEAGGPLQDRIVTLDRVHRYGEEIAALAEAVRAGDAEKVIELLEAGGEQIEWIDADPGDPASMPLLEPVRAATVAAGRAAFEAAATGDAATALEALGRHRILCAHRRGPHGVRRWNQQAEAWIADEVEAFNPYSRWYIGRPLLITENNYELKLFNGDTGIVVRRPDETVVAAFQRGDEIVEFSPTQLDAVETVYAMTIHKSQGSQFDAVSVLLPPEGSRILTRELLYTAVTRSRKTLQMCGPSATLSSAATHAIARASGLIRRMPTRPSRRARLPRP